jgi:integrase
VLLWSDPTRQLPNTATHVWWSKLLERAGVPYLRMHGGRHTALTRVWRQTGDLELTRQLAGHRSIQTTADIYVQSDVHDLARGLSKAFRESSTSNHDENGPTKP